MSDLSDFNTKWLINIKKKTDNDSGQFSRV